MLADAWLILDFHQNQYMPHTRTQNSSDGPISSNKSTATLILNQERRSKLLFLDANELRPTPANAYQLHRSAANKQSPTLPVWFS
jgi:hypothetical protein